MNPARPASGVILCAVEDLADPGSKGFEFRRDDFLFRGFLVRLGGVVRGYVDRCPHIGSPLPFNVDQYLARDGRHVLCSTHGALFRAEDGLCVAGPCAGRSLWPWDVRIEAGQVVTG